MILVLISASAVMLAVASALLSWRAFQKLTSTYSRIHLLERTRLDVERQLTAVSRAASRSEARARAGGNALPPEPHAQHGEEYFLWERLGFKLQGSFVEIGAYNGVSLSNSLFFEQLGWRGVLVEAHPDLVEQCRQSRPLATVVHAALGSTDGGSVTFSMVRGAPGMDTLSFVTTSERHRQRIESRQGKIDEVVVPRRTLKSVLVEAGVTDIDWISVDVEGAELDVLRGAGLEEFKPKIIMVEDNSGGVDELVDKFLSCYGYQRKLTVGCNDIYCLASAI